MLVACQLVNLTTWEQAEPAWTWLRRRYVHPRILRRAHEEDLHEALRPLGLWRRRSNILIRFANAWSLNPPATAQEVLKMPGCGKYAADTWALFVEGRRDVQPTDGKLLWHLQQLETEHGHFRRDGRVQP